MPSSLEEIELGIREATEAGFRNNLLARGQARSMIWRDGVLPEDAPNFSNSLSYDLLSYGYSLLGMGLRLRDLGGDADLARSAFEAVATALEAVTAKGRANDRERGFHQLVAGSAYHLGRFSARAYSVLAPVRDSANHSPIERAISLLILRDFWALGGLVRDWKLDGPGGDERLVELLAREVEHEEAATDDDLDAERVDEELPASEALDAALTDGFMGAIGYFLLAVAHGDTRLVEIARGLLSRGVSASHDADMPLHWWGHRLALHLLDDLWSCSFNERLPLPPPKIAKFRHFSATGSS